jgi:elongation factor P hydroxylase
MTATATNDDKGDRKGRPCRNQSKFKNQSIKPNHHEYMFFKNSGNRAYDCGNFPCGL